MTDSTNRPRHAPLPWICTTCQDAAEAEADKDPAAVGVVRTCHHAHPGFVTIGLATMHAGRITSWDLHGPLPPDQAMALARNIQQVSAQAASTARKGRPLQ